MNCVIRVVSVKTLVMIVMGIGVLVLAGYGALALLNMEPGFGPAVGASGADEGVAAPGEGAAPTVNASGPEQDLKETSQCLILTKANEKAAPTIYDPGLERDKKEIMQDRVSAGPQVQ